MTFDVEQFSNMVVTEANDTQLVPCPAGDFPGIIDSYKARVWKGRDDPTQSGVALDIMWTIDDAGVKEALGRDKVLVKHGIMLDMNEAGTGLDMGKGKNVDLGRLRQAIGMNTPGQPFTFDAMVGRAALVSVKHRPDKENPEKVYAEVKAVAPLG